MRKVAIITVSILFIITSILALIGFLVDKNVIYLKDGFYLLGDEVVTVGYNRIYKDAGYIAKLNGEDLKNKVTVNSNLDTSKLGIYNIAYVLDLGYTKKELTRKVKVEDNTPPILTIEENEIIVTKGEKFELPKYTAIDNYDGDISSKVEIITNLNTKKTGEYKVTLRVKDSNNNSIEEDIKVKVENKFDHTYIKISIKKQKLTYYEKNKVVFEADVTTGYNNATKTGNFKVNSKVKGTVLATKNYRTYVNYWMGYDGNRYGIHDAPWRKKFGGKEYLTNGSHGCVNIETKNAKKLFNMIEIGTPVYIRR